MKTPEYIEFHNETKSVLSRFLKATEPEEGCAILIGQKQFLGTNENNYWEVKHIWNCRNIWGERESKLIDKNTGTIPHKITLELSKINRFEIDPREQISSQKWARENNLEVLCFAHSHPLGENKPSKIDLLMHKSPGLMVISNKNGNLKAWWIKNKFSFHRVKIKNSSLP
tara:strand:- start:354 stop:863 length:510 start_codon:yes stop_codon:yes gene_type:complete